MLTVIALLLFGLLFVALFGAKNVREVCIDLRFAVVFLVRRGFSRLLGLLGQVALIYFRCIVIAVTLLLALMGLEQIL